MAALGVSGSYPRGLLHFRKIVYINFYADSEILTHFTRNLVNKVWVANPAKPIWPEYPTLEYPEFAGAS